MSGKEAQQIGWDVFALSEHDSLRNCGDNDCGGDSLLCDHSKGGIIA
jgi:hypothetical protein